MLYLERLRAKIAMLGERAIEQQRRRRDACDQALAQLARSPDPEHLRELVAHQEEEDADFALPVTEAPLDRRFTVEPAPPVGLTVIAVDGSQIMPDRHSAVLYYLIQVGGLVFCYDGSAPTSHRDATLHYDETELYDSDGRIIGHQVGMRRTVAELAFLSTLASDVRAEGDADPLVALTDGPLLWPYSGRSEKERTLLPAYMEALAGLRAARALPAGFVERPGGRPLLNTLNLLPSETTSDTGKESDGVPAHLDDRALMARHLSPGERTVWLKRHSPMNRQHAQQGHEIWFCYLNVGEPGHPVIGRVEIPQWATTVREGSTNLHAVLVHQALILHGYPYALARAHELALVTQEDKNALDALLQRRLMEAGLPTRPSEKARQKSYLGRRR